MKNRLLTLMLVATVLPACSPLYFMVGRVQTLPVSRSAASADAYASKPIPGATMRVFCEIDGKLEERHSATAGDDGVFRDVGYPQLWQGCQIRVEREGFHTRVYSTDEVCPEPAPWASCQLWVLNASLVPTAPGGTP